MHKYKDLVQVDSRALRDARESRGLTQVQLAAIVGISDRSVQNYERTGYGPVKCAFGMVEHLATALKMDAASLIVGDDASQPNLARDLSHLLAEASRDLSEVSMKAALREVCSQARAAKDSDSLIHRLHAEALVRLAEIEQSYTNRERYRKKAIDVLSQSARATPDAISIVALANVLVDYVYDVADAPGPDWLRGQIKQVLRTLEQLSAAEGSTSEEEVHTQLLLTTQASSLYRAQGFLASDEGKEMRNGIYRRMFRCAEKALKLGSDRPIAQLEYGQALARWADWLRNEEYDDQLARAEKYIRLAAEGHLTVAWLTLARFLRFHYRAADAIATYRRFDDLESNRRLVLNDAQVAGEAAWQLWWNNKETESEGISYAHGLVLSAVNAGYRDARKVIVLGLLHAALAGTHIAETALEGLSSGKAGRPWSEVVDTAAKYVDTGNWRKLREGFAFGLDNGLQWGSLGTLTLVFLKDAERALRYYDVGLKLAPSHQTLLLNKGRAFLEIGDIRGAEAMLLELKLKRPSPKFSAFVEEFAKTLRARQVVPLTN